MRLFVAAEISDELKRELARFEEELASIPSFHLVKPENIHLTLKFMGEVSEEKLSKVKDALSAIPFTGLKLQTMKLGTFPGVLWLGVKLGSDLAQLQQEVQRAVLPFAMRDPRSYKPHLTIVRFGRLSPDRQLALESLIKDGRIEVRWKVDHFTLYKSTLTSQGLVYEALARFSSENN